VNHALATAPRAPRAPRLVPRRHVVRRGSVDRIGGRIQASCRSSEKKFGRFRKPPYWTARSERSERRLVGGGPTGLHAPWGRGWRQPLKEADWKLSRFRKPPYRTARSSRSERRLVAGVRGSWGRVWRQTLEKAEERSRTGFVGGEVAVVREAARFRETLGSRTSAEPRRKPVSVHGASLRRREVLLGRREILRTSRSRRRTSSSARADEEGAHRRTCEAKRTQSATLHDPAEPRAA
jgi:hypothetical protein